MGSSRSDGRPLRRGVYAALSAGMATSLLGFGALAVDVAYVRLVQTQAQGVADAAAQAALLALRRTGDPGEAQAAAEAVAALHRIGTGPAEVVQVEWGLWDHQAASPALVPQDEAPNAVRVAVQPEGGSLALGLAPILGFESFQVQARATAASRPLSLVVVQDASPSWSQDDFAAAREGLLDLLDTLENSYGDQDRIGLVVYHHRYAYEYTPLTRIADIATDPWEGVRASWSELNVFSQAGVPTRRGCREHRGDRRNDFGDPSGGCYPASPRAYDDERGADPTAGLSMALQMLDEEEASDGAVHLLLLLTDGPPEALEEGGDRREEAGYREERWREYAGPVPRSAEAVRAEALDLSEEMWAAYRVHTYVVSYGADDGTLEQLPTGQGHYALAHDAEELGPLIQGIAESIPLTLVE